MRALYSRGSNPSMLLGLFSLSGFTIGTSSLRSFIIISPKFFFGCCGTLFVVAVVFKVIFALFVIAVVFKVVVVLLLSCIRTYTASLLNVDLNIRELIKQVSLQ